MTKEEIAAAVAAVAATLPTGSDADRILSERKRIRLASVAAALERGDREMTSEMVDVLNQLSAAKRASVSALPGAPARTAKPTSEGYATAFAARHGIDLSRERERFAALAASTAADALRAADAGHDARKTARIASHFAALAGVTPAEDVLSLAGGELARDEDFG